MTDDEDELGEEVTGEDVDDPLVQALLVDKESAQRLQSYIMFEFHREVRQVNLNIKVCLHIFCHVHIQLMLSHGMFVIFSNACHILWCVHTQIPSFNVLHLFL